MIRYLLVGLAGIIVTLLATWATLIVLVMASWEEICFDRWPWWGPPESGTHSNCAGHISERREAGYGWLGGPK